MTFTIRLATLMLGIVLSVASAAHILHNAAQSKVTYHAR